MASAAFVVLVAASAGRAAWFPADVRRDLTRPDRVFSFFAVPAAASVLAARVADRGQHVAVAALTATTVLAWAVACGLVLAFLAARTGPLRDRITDVNGTWQLWVVGTQSVAIAATSAYAAGLVPDRLAAWAGLVAWSAGAVLYLLVTALVITRLVTVGLAPGDPFSPYWVTMGAPHGTGRGAGPARHRGDGAERVPPGGDRCGARLLVCRHRAHPGPDRHRRRPPAARPGRARRLIPHIW